MKLFRLLSGMILGLLMNLYKVDDSVVLLFDLLAMFMDIGRLTWYFLLISTNEKNVFMLNDEMTAIFEVGLVDSRIKAEKIVRSGVEVSYNIVSRRTGLLYMGLFHLSTSSFSKFLIEIVENLNLLL